MPKLSVASVQVIAEGIVGDQQKNLKYHGVPDRALCLWSLAIIQMLQIEITDYAAPCRKNMRWFSDRRFSRISQRHHPGSSRLYARVLQGGVVTTGDPVQAVALASAPDATGASGL